MLALLVVGLVACSDEPAPGTGAEEATIAPAACGARVGHGPELSAQLAALRDAFVEEAGLPDAPLYRRYRVVCDDLRASRVAVPASWASIVKGPTDVTIGPDLEAPVEDEPVVGVGAARFVGEPTPPSAIMDGNAGGSLENGRRQPPRRGRSVIDGCTARPARPYAFAGYTGETRAYVDCDGENRAWLYMAAFADNGDKCQVQMIAQALTTADAEALVRALATLRVDGRRVPGMQLPPLPVPTTASASVGAADG